MVGVDETMLRTFPKKTIGKKKKALLQGKAAVNTAILLAPEPRPPSKNKVLAKIAKERKRQEKKKRKRMAGESDLAEDTRKNKSHKSLEYRMLENSSDDNSSVVSVSDMLPDGEEGEFGYMQTICKLVGPVDNEQQPDEGGYESSDLEGPSSTNRGMEDSEDEISEGPDEDELLSEKFREEVASMPLGKVRELKNKLGIKLFNKAFFGTDAAAEPETERKTQAVYKRDNRKRPREVSSKRPVSRFRDVYANETKSRKRGFDPRFDDRCGEYNEALFEQNYAHIDDIRRTEKESLLAALRDSKAEGDTMRTTQLKQAVKRIEDRERTQRDRNMKRQTVRDLKKENMERMKQGLQPIFKTKAQVRHLNAEKKFTQLKQDGTMDKYLERIEKKRKIREKKANRKPFDV